MFKIFLILRFISVIVIQTWFVPDETWQATEVSHYWSFKYGYLTWEWKEGIRSFSYPLLFSFIYSLLRELRMDYIFALTQAPRLLSSIIFTFGDYYMYKVSIKLFGKASSHWVSVCLCTSWFLAYCAPRTLTSCVEMTLFAVALYNYPWNNEKVSVSVNYLVWVGLSCMMRPTMAVFFSPYCIRHLILSQRRNSLFLRYFITVVVLLSISIAVDSVFYGKLTIVAWNFLKFNFLSGLSSHYGTHSWHWYFSQGLPVTCGLHLVPLIWGLSTNFEKYKIIFLPSLLTIGVFSVLGHKEFRFLLPIIPLLLVIAGDSIFVYLKTHERDTRKRSRRKLIVGFFTIPNALVLLYMGLIHQRGPIDVMTSLSSSLDSKPNATLLFLTPCHSTPLYSHLHKNIPVRFVTCQPNLSNEMNYEDESDIFFKDPLAWIEEYLRKESAKGLPTHVIMFDSLAARTEPFLKRNNYSLCEEIFNAHFYETNRGKYFHIYCQT